MSRIQKVQQTFNKARSSVVQQKDIGILRSLLDSYDRVVQGSSPLSDEELARIQTETTNRFVLVKYILQSIIYTASST